MSMIFYKNPVNSIEETYALIKTKTGIEIMKASEETSSSGAEVRVKFPDMDNFITLNANGINPYYENSKGKEWIIFADASNHFLSIAQHYTDTYVYHPADNSSHALGMWMRLFIYENVTLNKIVSRSYAYGSNSDYWSRVFNIGANPQDTIRDKITIYQAFLSTSKTDEDAGLAKNLFLNYERMFEPGLKFIDQNGNKFVTLGGYLLYKVD